MLILMHSTASPTTSRRSPTRSASSASSRTRCRARSASPSPSPATPGPVDPGALRAPARRRRGGLDLQAVEAGVARDPSARHRHHRQDAGRHESQLGGGIFGIIAGPCAVETREQTLAAARAVRAAGARFLRGGAYKPRTSPYSFQGTKLDGLKILAEARAETGPAGGHRGDRSVARRAGGRVRRRPADRHAQRAELRAARGGGRRCASRCCSSAACRRRSRSS